MEEEELNPEDTYYLLAPFLNEIQDELYFLLTHQSHNGNLTDICENLNITEEQGEEIIEQIKEIQFKEFPNL